MSTPSQQLSAAASDTYGLNITVPERKAFRQKDSAVDGQQSGSGPKLRA